MLELNLLLDCVEEVLPIGEEMWKQVIDMFEPLRREHNFAPRSVESYRSKFKKLKNSKKPTGSATVPEVVRRAKRISGEIADSCNVVGFDEANADEEEDGGDGQGDEMQDEPLDVASSVGPLTTPVRRHRSSSVGSERSRSSSGSSSSSATRPVRRGRGGPNPVSCASQAQQDRRR